MENQNNLPGQLTSESQAPVSDLSAKKRRFLVIFGIALLFLLFLLFLTVGGIYYLNRSQSNPQSQSQQKSEPLPSQEASKPVTYQWTTVTSPDQFGFTKLLKMKGIGVQAQFPQNVNLSFQQENFYVAKVGQDTVTFELKNYDGGGGRRAWFQKEYPYYKNYSLITFNGGNHSGYIAYLKTSQGNNPGSYFYFTAVNSQKMLVVHGINNISGNGIFFGGNLDKFKSFLSAVELTAAQNTGFETFPQVSDLYRWSDIRKTLWEDANLGLKITAPEWIESRYAKEKDSEGKFAYTDWKRAYPEAKSYESSYFSENIKRIEVTGGYISSQTLSILSSKYQDKSFSEVASELLIPAGFCTTEWKNSKTECAGSEYCYTRDEVIKNLIVKKQIKIGTLDAQLRNMNQGFSNKNDCRAGDIWLIKAKNSQFVLSDIFPDTETVRLEGI